MTFINLCPEKNFPGWLCEWSQFSLHIMADVHWQQHNVSNCPYEHFLVRDHNVPTSITLLLYTKHQDSYYDPHLFIE